MIDQLQSIIERWDGKSTALLEENFIAFVQNPLFVPTLIELTTWSHTNVGSTWLLKRHIEADGQLTPVQVNQLYTKLSNLDHWEAKLHFLQILPQLPIEKENLPKLEPFVRACLQAKKPFVRAWAYNGFYEMARHFSKYEDEAMGLFFAVMEDEKERASVKARVRNILKKGF